MSALTAAEQRLRTARCNGATPLLSTAFGSAPAPMSLAMIFVWALGSHAGKPGPTINSIAKGLRAASVPRANVRAPGDQLLGNAHLICRYRDMQGGIALVHVVQDLLEKVRFGGLPSRAMSSAFFCQ